jgi:pimeloyl-ACP methyl ester carboxylesterase
LLHGGGSTIDTTFGRILPALARSRQVIAFEQQGHGRTADVDRPFSFAQSAEDTAALLQALDIDSADFFGFSNGGHIALEVAIRHSGLVHKLIVASAGISRDGHYAEFWQFMEQAKLETMPVELRDAYVRLSPHPERLPTFFEKSVKRMRGFEGWPLDKIRSIESPTLVLVGDADNVRPEHAVEMFRLLPSGRLAILPGGHGSYIGELTGAKLANATVQFEKRAGDVEDKVPQLAVALIESFLDAPNP